MLDIKLIRESPDRVRENLSRRNDSTILDLLDRVIVADKKWRQLQTDLNTLRHDRNEISLKISDLKKHGKDASSELLEAERISKTISGLEGESDELSGSIHYCLMRLPNLLDEGVPYGKDETQNVVIRAWGRPPKFDFAPKDHLSILLDLGLIDVERGAKTAGERFYYLKKDLVLLDYAILDFGLRFMIDKGHIPIEPPYMMNRKAYEGATDLADFENVMYKIDGEDLYMIATSEHPMLAMFMDEVLLKDALPMRFVGISPCFRKEVGAHGKYTKGLFRMHQFHKVEQFIFCVPEESRRFHEELQQNSEQMYQKLGIHYRVSLACTGDIGTIASKRYDVEMWMADGNYREIGSNSNCTDYQARRSNIKYREKEGQPPVGFVHTLNNTALATSRTLIAMLEQNQNADGSVTIPEPLRDYMGKDKLARSEK